MVKMVSPIGVRIRTSEDRVPDLLSRGFRLLISDPPKAKRGRPRKSEAK